jgi:hypothetical protein
MARVSDGEVLLLWLAVQYGLLSPELTQIVTADRAGG